MRPGYRPDIDGLRALAVLTVVLCHAGLGFPGGFIGVDVFFVISGYLITGLIVKPDFRLAVFWERRFRRIFPALAVVVAVTLVAGRQLLLPPDLVDLARSVLAQGVMAANLFFWQTTGYFHGLAREKPLLHTWSLAVEEQFYLLYPALLLGLPRLRRVGLALVFVASLGLSAYGAFAATSATFYWLPTRAWELLLGGLLVLIPLAESSPLEREAGAWLGLLAILGCALFYSDKTIFPGLTALPACCGTAMVILCKSGNPNPSRPAAGATRAGVHRTGLLLMVPVALAYPRL